LQTAKIKDIRDGMENVNITARVTAIERRGTVETRYGPAETAVAVIEDETGRIRLKLWRSQIDKAKVGSMVRIENAFASTFDGRLELNVGSRGKIEGL